MVFKIKFIKSKDKIKKIPNKTIRHDLKSPIAVISGYAQLLISKCSENSKEKRWSLEIFNQTQKLVVMIDSYLEDDELKSNTST